MLKRHLNQITVALALAATLPLSFALSAAPSWPTKPIKLIVPYAPGGATDIIARTLAEKLSDRLGQPVLIDNRAGAGGVTGTDAAAKSPADCFYATMEGFKIATKWMTPVLVLTDGGISLDVPVEIATPRLRGDQAFISLRSRLLAELGVEEVRGHLLFAISAVEQEARQLLRISRIDRPEAALLAPVLGELVPGGVAQQAGLRNDSDRERRAGGEKRATDRAGILVSDRECVSGGDRRSHINGECVGECSNAVIN